MRTAKEIMTNQSKTKNDSQKPLVVKLISFGFKNGPPPHANLVLDVRFLKNPYWVEHLRPLTGLDQPVRAYVIEQNLAQEVLNNLQNLLADVIPAMLSVKSDSFIIALGCTGGQHRSTAMVQELADILKKSYPQYSIEKEHRELESITSSIGESR